MWEKAICCDYVYYSWSKRHLRLLIDQFKIILSIICSLNSVQSFMLNRRRQKSIVQKIKTRWQVLIYFSFFNYCFKQRPKDWNLLNSQENTHGYEKFQSAWRVTRYCRKFLKHLTCCLQIHCLCNQVGPFLQNIKSIIKILRREFREICSEFLQYVSAYNAEPCLMTGFFVGHLSRSNKKKNSFKYHHF